MSEDDLYFVLRIVTPWFYVLTFYFLFMREWLMCGLNFLLSILLTKKLGELEESWG
jgi:hypothetical protein